MRIRFQLITILTASISIAISPSVQAETDQELIQLRSQISEMQQRLETQNSALRAMSSRIQQLEAQGKLPGDNAANAKPQPPQIAQGNRQTPVQTTTASPDKQPVVKEAPATRSTETVYQEQHALFDRKFSIDAGLAYTHSDRRDLFLNGFLALDAIFLGNISIDSIKADTWTFDVTGRYSPTDRLQFDFNVPYLYRDSTFSSVGAGFSTSSVAEESVSNGDIGDVSAGIFYRLIPETQDRADTVISLRVKAPTGKDPYGIKFVRVADSGQNLNVPTELPTGNGVWATTAGVSFIKTLDPAILFSNFAYTYNFKDSFSDISSDPNLTQAAEVNLGNQYSVGAGMAFALNENLSLSMAYAHQFTEQSRVKLEGGPWQDVNGSDSSSGVISFGVTYGFADHLALQANVGVGVTTDAPDIRIGFRLPYSF